MALSFAAGVAVYAVGRGRSRLFLSAALTMQLVFALGTKMHERYICPRWRCSFRVCGDGGISGC